MVREDEREIRWNDSKSADAGDFVDVMRRRGMSRETEYPQGHLPVVETKGTTILAFKFAGGVLVAGDRRATAGNGVMYARAHKVLAADKDSVLAVAGAFGRAWGTARTLAPPFQV